MFVAVPPRRIRRPPSPRCVISSLLSRENGADGLHLAWSVDGLQWTALKGDKSFLTPKVGREKLMRDPCITQTPDGTFHMVWTVGWNDRVIGYASSRDLISWSPQHAIPVMEHEPTARNCWAPEIIWDQGACPVPDLLGDDNPRTVSGDRPHGGIQLQPSHLRHDDAGFPDVYARRGPFYAPTDMNVIDATLLHAGVKWWLIFKDEARDPVPEKNLSAATGDDIEGPFTLLPEPLTPGGRMGGRTPPRSRSAGDTLIYFDGYRAGPLWRDPLARPAKLARHFKPNHDAGGDAARHGLQGVPRGGQQAARSQPGLTGQVVNFSRELIHR